MNGIGSIVMLLLVFDRRHVKWELASNSRRGQVGGVAIEDERLTFLIFAISTFAVPRQCPTKGRQKSLAASGKSVEKWPLTSSYSLSA